ncbi:SNF5-domain-containing protein [Backusella circina FSU 941]|nr:SNF5-domain-containing protein [Backusella circina FSU 941]
MMQNHLSPLQLQQQQQQRFVAMMHQQQQQQQQQRVWEDARTRYARPPQQQQQQQQQQQPFIIPAVNSPTTPTTSNVPSATIETQTHKKHLKSYETRDHQYQETLNTQHKRHIHMAQEKKRLIEFTSHERRIRLQNGPLLLFGQGYRRYTNGPNRVVYPHQRKRLRASREFKFSLNALTEQANKEDTLVPIRLDLEYDGYKLRDTFTWNLNETLVTPEQFGEIMCEDLKLPSPVANQIAKAIREQLDDYYLNAASMLIRNEDDEQVKELEIQQQQPKEEDQEEGTIIHKKQNELRTLIKLDITVGNRELIDQFEWDITCTKNSPETFAERLATELGLGGEFKTAIAHSIREQIHVYSKSLLLAGYEFDGTGIIDDDLRHSFLPSINGIVRDHNLIERFTPIILELTDVEIEKMEKDRMRETRRKRRGTRARRGVTLPDREPQKTHRTAFSLPPEQELTDEQFLMNINNTNDDSGYHSQRKSAIKARMNIAAEAAGMGLHSPSQTPQPMQQDIITLSNARPFIGDNRTQGKQNITWQPFTKVYGA